VVITAVNFCMLKALPAVQPAVSKHWRELKKLTTIREITHWTWSYLDSLTREGRDAALFTPAPDTLLHIKNKRHVHIMIFSPCQLLLKQFWIRCVELHQKLKVQVVNVNLLYDQLLWI